MHKTIADILHKVQLNMTLLEKRDAEQKIDNALVTCVHALCCAVNYTMKTSLGAMVFNQDMFMDVQLLADLDPSVEENDNKLMTMPKETTRNALITITE